MKMHDLYALAVVSFLMTCTLMVAVSCAGINIDVNGYHAKGGSTGSVQCKGACP